MRLRSPLYIAVELGQRDVALVDDHQEVVGEVLDQVGGRLSGQPALEVAAVVLHAGAVADVLDHLQVVADALLQALVL